MERRNGHRYIIGIDTGGTFTDAVVLTETGELIVDKAPTTPHDFSIGVMDSVAEVAKDMSLTPQLLLEQTAMFKHGCTVATNALITRTGAKVGLITTAGFEDTTLIMRAIGRVAGLSEDEIKHQATATKPDPIVPKRLIKGVHERIDFRGNVVCPINVEEAREALRSFIEDEKVEAIAVNFLFGFVNPVHEKKIKELVQEMYPNTDVFFSYAHELVPVVREYARSNTVIINSFLGKTIQNYTRNMAKQLQERGFKGPLMLMQANGGIVHQEEMTAVGSLSSGPAGGVIATKYMADILGHPNVISTDMGGTSFDVGLLTDGFWSYAREPVVSRFHVTWPMIDIESIGAGGGTMARVDPVTKRLLVGPKSAGAYPGPVSYDTGGTEPTVTDADLILGLLDPNYFLGGRKKLNKAKAEQAIKEKIADPLGMTVIEAAAGIYDIINSHMSDLIRKQVVRTGHIPEEYVIYSFGGAGPVHATAYGSELGVRRIYVFPTSAVFSAFGIAAADVIHTYTSSYRYTMPTAPEILNERLGGIEKQLYEVMAREGFERKDVEFRRTFHMRYRRQMNELAVQVPVKEYKAEDVKEIMDIFEKRYEEVYGEGSAYSEAGMELISFEVDAIGKTLKPVLKSYPEGGKDPSKALKDTRDAFFTDTTRAWVKTRIYDYERLQPGNVVEGPAIVETPITTIVIPPSRLGRVDRYMNMELEST